MIKRKQTTKRPIKARPSGRVVEPVARSLHIGMNSVSPTRYAGWSGNLIACEADAKAIAEVAKRAGITPTVLAGRNATRANVLARIRASAKKMKDGDLFVLSYSGFGGQVPDVNDDEDDKKDETWCLFDGQLLDDELSVELTRFAEGVRIVILSDTCHSGTVTRAALHDHDVMTPSGHRPKLMPAAVALRTYREHKAFYDKLQRDVVAATRSAGKVTDPKTASTNASFSGMLSSFGASCKAPVIMLSACQDNQTAMEGDHHGLFTEHLLTVWNSGKYVGTYVSFHATIRSQMPPTQSPSFVTLGPATALAKERPFSV